MGLNDYATLSITIHKPNISSRQTYMLQWVPVILTGKVSDSCIRDLEFNPRLHQEQIGVLV